MVDKGGKPALATDAANIDSPRCARLFLVCAVAYLAIYAVEGPIRYGLFHIGADSLILLRDTLIIVPLVVLAVTQSLRLRLHPAFVLSLALLGFHGLVLMGTVGSALGAAFGAKILINMLFGFFVASSLLSPDGRTLKLLTAVWVILVVGILLDKFVLSFPWVGLKTQVGDLTVDVSKDWQVTDPLSRRVAGFSRGSTAAAMIIPCVSIVLMSRTGNGLLRCALAMVAFGAVALTTQKGAVLAFAPVAMSLCLPPAGRLTRLRLLFLVFLAATVALPLLTRDLHMSHGSGVFSAASFNQRVVETWPGAWRWIERHQMTWLGVGLGGIGGPQRLYAPGDVSPVDNLALLLYAYFGIFAIVYGMAICVLVLRPVAGAEDRVEPALAILAFAAGYGAVVSVLEDQSASLFVGAALGVLCREAARKKVLQPSAATSAAYPF